MNSFEKNGYEVSHFYNKITTEIDGKTYLICNKKFGKTDYSEEIENSYKDAIKKGIIPLNKWVISKIL